MQISEAPAKDAKLVLSSDRYVTYATCNNNGFEDVWEINI